MEILAVWSKFHACYAVAVLFSNLNLNCGTFAANHKEHKTTHENTRDACNFYSFFLKRSKVVQKRNVGEVSKRTHKNTENGKPLLVNRQMKLKPQGNFL